MWHANKMEKEKIENEEKSKEEDIDIKIPNVFKKINKKHILEISIVLVFIIALLGTMSVFDGGRLIHPEAPYNFAAGDMFTFSAFSDVARYEEDLTKQPAYLSAGRDDGINFFSMFGAVITAQIADFMNTDTYDYIIHFNLVCLILSIFIIYWFLRKFNVYLAMFSLPITLLVFKWPFNYTINWGKVKFKICELT